MLKTFVQAGEIYRNSTRPAIYDSLKSMLKFYGLDSAAEVFYNGENEIAKLVGSNATDNLRTDTFTDGLFRNKIFIVPTIEPSPFNSGYANSRRTLTERPVWQDEDLGIMVVPSFEGRRITVEVNAHFNDRNKAQEFVNTINYRQANQIADMAFSAYIHLPVNTGILAFLEHAHELLVKNDPTAEPDCPTWFGARCKAPMTTATNAAGNNAEMLVPMRIDNLGVQFEEPRIRLAQKAQLVGKYEVALTYFFYFQEFIGWDVEYPLNIYQDEIDAQYIPAVNEQYERGFTNRSNIELAFANQLTPYNRSEHSPYFLCLPKHDPFRKEYQNWMVPVFQVRLAVADVERQELAALSDIPDIEWNETVMKYILRRHAKAFSHHDTPFLFSTYSSDIKVLPIQLEMNETGSTFLVRPPTMKNTYRLMLDVDMAIRDYSQDFWDDLMKHPEDWGILPGIFPWYDWTDWDKKFPQCIDDINIGGDFIPKWDRLMSWMGLIAYRG